MLSKIWFQLSGSHHREHPERILHKDGRFCIYGYHNMNADIDGIYGKYVGGEAVNFAGMKHDRIRVQKPPLGGYPNYSWVYDNKAASDYMIGVANQIMKFDKNVFFIVFGTYPFKSVFELFRKMKSIYPIRCHCIYYKRFFWENNVGKLKGVNRSLFPHKDGSLDEHFISESVENDIVKISDRVFLADSINTAGTSELDSNDDITRILDFKDEYLRSNPNIKLMSINKKVYDIMDEVVLK